MAYGMGFGYANAWHVNSKQCTNMVEQEQAG